MQAGQRPAYRLGTVHFDRGDLTVMPSPRPNSLPRLNILVLNRCQYTNKNELLAHWSQPSGEPTGVSRTLYRQTDGPIRQGCDVVRFSGCLQAVPSPNFERRLRTQRNKASYQGLIRPISTEYGVRRLSLPADPGQIYRSRQCKILGGSGHQSQRRVHGHVIFHNLICGGSARIRAAESGIRKDANSTVGKRKFRRLFDPDPGNILTQFHGWFCHTSRWVPLRPVSYRHKLRVLRRVCPASQAVQASGCFTMEVYSLENR